jgi:hypothetical protein
LFDDELLLILNHEGVKGGLGLRYNNEVGVHLSDVLLVNLMQPVDGYALMLRTLLDASKVEHHEEYPAQDYHGQAEDD